LKLLLIASTACLTTLAFVSYEIRANTTHQLGTVEKRSARTGPPATSDSGDPTAHRQRLATPPTSATGESDVVAVEAANGGSGAAAEDSTSPSLCRRREEEAEAEAEEAPFLPPTVLDSPDGLFGEENRERFLRLGSAGCGGGDGVVVDLVVTFVDASYGDGVFDVWYHHYRKHDYDDDDDDPVRRGSKKLLCLVALDGTAHESLRRKFGRPEGAQQSNNDNNTVVVMAPQNWKTSYRSLWEYRVKFLRQVTSTFPNWNVLFSDLDAIWVQDPFRNLIDGLVGGGADIVASRAIFPGGRCPIEVSFMSMSRSTACMGFIYFSGGGESGRAVRDLISLVETRLIENGEFRGDDQLCFNCVLFENYKIESKKIVKAKNRHEVPVFTYRPKRGSRRRQRGVNNTANSGNSSSKFKLALLPYTSVVRFCDSKVAVEQAVVAHCMIGMNREGKLQRFRQFDLLPPSMANVLGTENQTSS
jgi:hypothetical protein